MLDTVPLWEQGGVEAPHPALIGDARDDNDVMVLPITHARWWCGICVRFHAEDFPWATRERGGPLEADGRPSFCCLTEARRLATTWFWGFPAPSELLVADDYVQRIGFTQVAIPPESAKDEVYALLDMVLDSIGDDRLRNFS